jgi:hypothetical protein
MLNKLRNGLGKVLFIEKFCLTCVREACMNNTRESCDKCFIAKLFKIENLL